MGIFSKFKDGLRKTRDFVSRKMTSMAAGMGRFDEDMLDELEMTLIQADVGMDATSFLIDSLKDEIRKSGDNSSEHVFKTLREKMLEILGPRKNFELEAGKLNILLMVGVNGTGKTTTCGKLAKRYQEEGKSPVIAAADTFRAAAIEQLQVWGERSSCPVIANKEGGDPAAVVYDAVHAALSRQADVLLVDTAGRLHNKQNLMDELSKIRRILLREAPEAHLETLLVIDATTGQNALVQAIAFNEATPVDGLILTKLDGNAKGGVALAVVRESSLPLYFVGLGEGIDDLQDFDPDFYVTSLLPENLEEEA